MARYKGSIANAGPLRIQLTTGSTNHAEVVRLLVASENTLGGVSRPTLTRPSTPGSGSGTVVPLNESQATPGSSIITTFSVAPSVPTVNVGNYNLPMAVEWVANPGMGFITGLAGSLLLYTSISGGHLLSGELVFEEKE